MRWPSSSFPSSIDDGRYSAKSNRITLTERQRSSYFAFSRGFTKSLTIFLAGIAFSRKTFLGISIEF